MYLQVVLIKHGSPCVDIVAVNVIGRAMNNAASDGGGGCWMLNKSPLGAQTVEDTVQLKVKYDIFGKNDGKEKGRVK